MDLLHTPGLPAVPRLQSTTSKTLRARCGSGGAQTILILRPPGPLGSCDRYWKLLTWQSQSASPVPYASSHTSVFPSPLPGSALPPGSWRDIDSSQIWAFPLATPCCTLGLSLWGPLYLDQAVLGASGERQASCPK